jgi:hypothetical protein
MEGILSPLPGLVIVLGLNPALTRWATFCRPSGPGAVPSGIGVVWESKVLSMVCPSSPGFLLLLPRSMRVPGQDTPASAREPKPRVVPEWGGL